MTRNSSSIFRWVVISAAVLAGSLDLPACGARSDEFALGFGQGGADSGTPIPVSETGGFGTGGYRAPLCGDGMVEGNEECDTSNFLGQTCATATRNARPFGLLRCTSACTLVVSGCAGYSTGTGGFGAGGFGAGGSPGMGAFTGAGGIFGAGGVLGAGGALGIR